MQAHGDRMRRGPSAGRVAARVLLLGLVALGAAGCGFKPMLATQAAAGSGSESGDRDLDGVAVGPIKDRLGQMVRNALVERITPRGEPSEPRCLLQIDLTRRATDIGYRRDTYATLGQLSLTAQYALSCGRVVILSDSSVIQVNFDYLGPRYASIAMERDAEDRAVVQLADQLRASVALALAEYRANPKDRRYRPLRGTGDGLLLDEAGR